MTIGHVNAGAHASHARGFATGKPSVLHEKFHVGQRLNMTVMRRIDEQNYLVSMAGGQHVVESGVPLDPGSRVQAVVVAIGDRLELKYLDPGELQTSHDEDPQGAESAAPVTGLLSSLESRFKMALNPADHDTLEKATRVAADPAAMALGGLYLLKLGVPVDPQALEAIYGAQKQPSGRLNDVATAHDISSLIAPTLDGQTSESGALAELLASAVSSEAPSTGVISLAAGGTDSQRPDTQSQTALAHYLLNLQDEGGVAYHYGTLPVLIAGQLVELDLVLFQQRQPESSQAQVRRLVMTLDTQSFGSLQIEARALNDRLVITFTGKSPEAVAELSSYEQDVRELATRLGWGVEAVGYEYDGGATRAARQVIEHVLSAGTVDRVL